MKPGTRTQSCAHFAKAIRGKRALRCAPGVAVGVYDLDRTRSATEHPRGNLAETLPEHQTSSPSSGREIRSRSHPAPTPWPRRWQCGGESLRLAGCPVLTVRHPEREFVTPDALQLLEHARK